MQADRPRPSYFLSSGPVLAAFLLVILVSKWPVLREPPVWDASMSVFPAAITLAHTDFDLAGLLARPGYLLGGPNVHALSLVTWVTALAYRMLGDRPEIVLPALHLLHFVIGAVGLTALWRVGRELLGEAAALAVVATVFLFPPLFVQTGSMYLELPLFALCALAVDDWIRGRRSRAAVWVTLAALVKPTGAIVVGALALCSLLEEGPVSRRLHRAGALLAGPLLIATVSFVFRPEGMPGFGSLRVNFIYLVSVPDQTLALLGFGTLSAIWRPWRRAVVFRSTGAEPGRGDRSARAQLAFAALLVSFFAFFALLHLLGSSVPILPRYYLLLVPFVLVGLAAMLRPRLRPRVALVLLLLVSTWFLVNRRGRFYPRNDINNFGIIERSMAYTDLLALQRQGLERLTRLDPETPVFYGLPEHYKLRYPEMGYGLEAPKHGHCILNETPYHAGRLSDFPASFYVLYEFPWLGGEVALRVVAQARADRTRSVEAAPVRVGRFESVLFRIGEAGAEPAAAGPGPAQR